MGLTPKAMIIKAGAIVTNLRILMGILKPMKPFIMVCPAMVPTAEEDKPDANKALVKAILFGSRANGTHFLKSDYDVCIVVKDDEHKPEVLIELTKLMQKNNVIIHPFIYTVSEFTFRFEIDVFYQNIVQNGKVLINRI